jgi:acylphosphatase
MAKARRAPPPRRRANSTSQTIVVSEVTRRFRVTGRVQGVYFRHSTRLEAERLALSGYARNLPDGSVEVAVRGPASAVGELHQWLHRGPKSARVAAVEEMDPTLENSADVGEIFQVL